MSAEEGRFCLLLDSRGSYVSPKRQTSEVYRRFLVNDLQVSLEHVTIHQRQPMWFMREGAPHPHTVADPHFWSRADSN
jgi:hypothetical protein